MRQVGVRELKASLSAILHAARRGEPIRVTSRGRAIAEIVPPGTAADDDHLRALIADGRLVPPARARPARAPRLVNASQSASALVLDERDAER
jgi:prevent-host-death family protein